MKGGRAQSAMLRAVCILVAYFVTLSSSIPTMNVPTSVNLGTPIFIHFSLTDELDGREVSQSANGEQGSGKFLSKTGNDWIGLFPKGQCIEAAGSTNEHNNQGKHTCYIAWEYVPRHMAAGTIIFEAERYKSSGEFEARYFYGDDPTIPGTYEWVGQGWVCNSYSDDNSNGVRETYTPRVGLEGSPSVSGLTLAQCRCNPTVASQIIAYKTCKVDGVEDKAISQTACVSSCSNINFPTQASCIAATGQASGGEDPTWTARAWTDETIDQATCLSYRAACQRCVLDPAAYSSTITVRGPGGVDEYQDMKKYLPGFEIAF